MISTRRHVPLDRVVDAQLWSMLERMDREGVKQLPVTSGSQVVGMPSREDVLTFLRTLQELGTWRVDET